MLYKNLSCGLMLAIDSSHSLSQTYFEQNYFISISVESFLVFDLVTSYIFIEDQERYNEITKEGLARGFPYTIINTWASTPYIPSNIFNPPTVIREPKKHEAQNIIKSSNVVHCDWIISDRTECCAYCR